MERLEQNIFYTLEKAVKAYRQMVQRSLSAAGLGITLDQWLVLKTIAQDSQATQNQIAARVFKDVASVTRIVEILVSKGYLERVFLPSDRRRQQLNVTAAGEQLLEQVYPVSLANRQAALHGLDSETIANLQSSLQSIIKNVN